MKYIHDQEKIKKEGMNINLNLLDFIWFLFLNTIYLECMYIFLCAYCNKYIFLTYAFIMHLGELS